MSEARSYFSTLNYTLANEDTTLEWSLLRDDPVVPGDTVLTIAGSGGRVLPLLSHGPSRVVCADLAEPQLALTELRLALARERTLEEFLLFMGYPLPSSAGMRNPEGEATALRRRLIDRLELRAGTRNFLKSWFESLDWGSPIYEGRWEKTFQTLSRVVRTIMGSACEELMECRTLDEQKRYLDRHFPRFRWKAVIALLGNASVFNALLYKGSFPRKNIPGSRRSFYESRYERLFRQGPARESYFLQLCFLGRLVHPEGNPTECRPEVFEAAKRSLLKAQVEYQAGDAVEIAAAQQGRVGFFSFSDVPSYFRGEQERTFMQRIRPGLAPGARIVVRNYLRVPQACDLAGFKDESGLHQEAILAERVGVYDIDIFRYRPEAANLDRGDP